MARKHTQIKQPSKIERHDKNADKLVCVLVCEASRAPKTPVYQTRVIGLVMART